MAPLRKFQDAFLLSTAQYGFIKNVWVSTKWCVEILTSTRLPRGLVETMSGKGRTFLLLGPSHWPMLWNTTTKNLIPPAVPVRYPWAMTENTIILISISTYQGRFSTHGADTQILKSLINDMICAWFFSPEDCYEKFINPNFLPLYATLKT